MNFKQLAEKIKTANDTQLIEIKESFETGLKEYLKENGSFSTNEKTIIMEELTPEGLKSFLDDGFTKEETLFWASKGFNASDAEQFIKEFNSTTNAQGNSAGETSSQINTDSTGIPTTMNNNTRITDESMPELSKDNATLPEDNSPTVVNSPNNITMDKTQVPTESPDDVDIFDAPEFKEKNPNTTVKESVLTEADDMNDNTDDDDDDDNTDNVNMDANTEENTDEKSLPDDIEGISDESDDDDNTTNDELEDKSVICFYVDEEEMEEILGDVKDEGEPTEDTGGIPNMDNSPNAEDTQPPAINDENLEGEENPMSNEEDEQESDKEEHKPMEGYKKRINRILKEATDLIQTIKTTGLIVNDPRKTVAKMETEYPKGKVTGKIDDKDGAGAEVDADKKRVTDGEKSASNAIPSKYIKATDGKTVTNSKKETAAQLESYKRENDKLKKMNESLIKDLIIAEEASKLNDATKAQLKEAIQDVPVRECPAKIKILVEAHISRLNNMKNNKFKGLGSNTGSGLMESVSSDSNEQYNPVLQRMLDLARK